MKSWKKSELDVAKFFGSNRTPLSGGWSRHTQSDTLHEKLFIEVKYRVSHQVITLWDKTKKYADKEKKVPVVTLKEKGRPGFWLLIHNRDLLNVAEIVNNHNSYLSSD